MTDGTRAGHGTGVAMLVGAAVAFSAAGYFTRLIPLDVWTILFWRGLSSGLFLAIVLAARYRRDTAAELRRLGWPGLAIALASTCGTILYVHALRQTSVADVAVIYAASPFVTAVILWLWLGVRPTARTMGLSLVALLGVAIMVSGIAGEGRLLGDALALGMTLCMGVMMIVVHRHPEVPAPTAVCAASLLTAAAVWPLASPVMPSPAMLLDLALFGLQLTVGSVLMTLGGRRVPATEGALIGTLDAPLAPLLVLLAFGEIPAWQTVVGGAVVMAGVAVHVGVPR